MSGTLHGASRASVPLAFPTSVTPFVMDRSIVLALLAHFSSQPTSSPAAVANEYHAKRLLTSNPARKQLGVVRLQSGLARALTTANATEFTLYVLFSHAVQPCAHATRLLTPVWPAGRHRWALTLWQGLSEANVTAQLHQALRAQRHPLVFGLHSGMLAHLPGPSRQVIVRAALQLYERAGLADVLTAGRATEPIRPTIPGANSTVPYFSQPDAEAALMQCVGA